MDAKSLYPDWKKILTELVEHYGSAWKLTQAMQAIDSSISKNYYNAIATLLKQEQIKTMSYERGALLLHLHQQLKSVGSTESVGTESVGDTLRDQGLDWTAKQVIEFRRQAGLTKTDLGRLLGYALRTAWRRIAEMEDENRTKPLRMVLRERLDKLRADFLAGKPLEAFSHNPKRSIPFKDDRLNKLVDIIGTEAELAHRINLTPTALNNIKQHKGPFSEDQKLKIDQLCRQYGLV